MVARFLGVRVWELARVAVHYQDEARVILQAQYETKAKINKERVKAGALTTEIILPEY